MSLRSLRFEMQQSAYPIHYTMMGAIVTKHTLVHLLYDHGALGKRFTCDLVPL